MEENHKKKKSFILYTDTLNIIVDGLKDDAKIGQFLKAIIAYQNGVDFEDSDPAINIAISLVKAQFIRDEENYEKKSAINRANGMKGGRPRKNLLSEENRTLANETEVNQPKAEKADTDTVTVNATDTTNVVEKKKPKKEKKVFVKPTIENVKDYFHEQWGYSFDAEIGEFFWYYESVGWMTSGGKHLVSWEAAAQKWVSKSQKNESNIRNYSTQFERKKLSQQQLGADLSRQCADEINFESADSEEDRFIPVPL